MLGHLSLLSLYISDSEMKLLSLVSGALDVFCVLEYLTSTPHP